MRQLTTMNNFGKITKSGRGKEDKEFMREDYRMTLYLGTGEIGRGLRQQIDDQAATDIRFRGSPVNFVRYCVKWALEHDKSLKRSAKSGGH